MIIIINSISFISVISVINFNFNDEIKNSNI